MKTSQVNDITKWLEIEEKNLKILSLNSGMDKKGNKIPVVKAIFLPNTKYAITVLH